MSDHNRKWRLTGCERAKSFNFEKKRKMEGRKRKKKRTRVSCCGQRLNKNGRSIEFQSIFYPIWSSVWAVAAAANNTLLIEGPIVKQTLLVRSCPLIVIVVLASPFFFFFFFSFFPWMPRESANKSSRNRDYKDVSPSSLFLGGMNHPHPVSAPHRSSGSPLTGFHQ